MCHIGVSVVQALFSTAVTTDQVIICKGHQYDFDMFGYSGSALDARLGYHSG